MIMIALEKGTTVHFLLEAFRAFVINRIFKQ